MSSFTRYQHFVCSSSSSSGLGPPAEPLSAYFLNGKFVSSYPLVFDRYYVRKKGLMVSYVGSVRLSFSDRFLDKRNHSSIFRELKRIDKLLPLASADDGVTINGSPQAGTRNDFDEMRYKLNQSLQDEDYNSGLVQLLHDASRIFEIAVREKTLSKTSWFSTAWLGVDNNTWTKPLSYQASVYCLLQAATEISTRGDERDRDVNVFLQRSILRHCAPLEGTIRDKLLTKGPEACEWFFSEQIPAAVSSFVNFFDENYFAPRTTMYKKGLSPVSGYSSDVSLLMLALSCIAAITKLGATKVSCAQFFSTIPDLTGRLVDMLVDYVPIHRAYNLMKEIRLRREFLLHFGPRAASCRMKNELGAEEIVFWVGLIQKQLHQAIHREKIWSWLTTSESIEVLERDLAIFGFFIALGRSSQTFLFTNGFENVDEPLEGFIRYLIGGSVLYYPQLSSISSYQLYVEVVCEELDWLPFFPGISNSSKNSSGHKQKEGPPNPEAINLVLDVCFHWIESFIKHSKWLENPANAKAARFLAKGYNKLRLCMVELGIEKDNLALNKESDSFDKALESVEEALLRLEELLKELHMSSSSSGKEHLKAACSDLERIRRLKKEAEFLEASFRAKEDSFRQDNVSGATTPSGEQREYSRGTASKISEVDRDKNKSSVGLWNSLVRRLTKSSDHTSEATKDSNELMLQETASKEMSDNDSNEIKRFEILRSELMELEKRVQRSANLVENEEEEFQANDDAPVHVGTGKANSLAVVEKKSSVIGKSLDKLKETSTDVLQGTQLLAIDTAAALGLLRRVLIGDELTEKEKQALRRTLTDLASVIPIGFLMLLPVTAVGHAAMLAAIQRYVPALIPSTYGHARLDLLRKLEKVKEMEDEVNMAETGEE